ncbi:MAG: FG-GAP repeat domain-containing protein [Planctomycetaceae bacterium]
MTLRLLPCRAASRVVVLAALTTAVVPGAIGADPPVTFMKIQLTDTFHAEGAGIGDIDKDGHGDAVYGPWWYAGPAFTVRHEIYPPEDFDPHKYSNNFITIVSDVDGDGWLDVLVNVWPGKEVAWFRNPGRVGGAWQRHLAFPTVDNESPQYADVTGDGRPELLFHTGGVLGFASPTDATGTDRWVFTPCSEKHAWGQYTHGLGRGDLNGDGRADLLMSEGWWEQPEKITGAPWTKHAFPFSSGAAQMHVSDVDGDGDGDVVTSLAAHGYGVAWYEQVRKDGAIDFVRHLILPDDAAASVAGVQFSQPHALEVADIDGDGLEDVVTGKRYWAHGPKGDADPGGAPVLYWFKLVREPGKTGADAVTLVPHRFDDASGVGTLFAVGDLDGDGRRDIVVGNQRGGFVFRQFARP